jgi:hypothetical protein
MSVTNFIPTIWSASVLRGFEKSSVFANCVSRDYAGEVSTKGDVVKVPKIGNVSIKDYTRGSQIAYDAVNGSTIDITVDQEKYWALKADDVDQMQSAPAFLDGATKNAAYALRDTVDSYTAGILSAGAGTKLFAGSPYTIGIPTAQGADDITIDLFTTLAMTLDELNIPREGRFVVIPPYVVKAITLSTIRAGMPNEKPIAEGFISRIAGFDVFMSNNLELDTDGNATVIAGVRAAATHILQIAKTETLRDQASFSDLIRGLAVYVSAVLLPEGLITALVKRPVD